MPIQLITADQRMAEVRHCKGAIFGPHGIGKTSLLWTLDPKETLFLNLEAGDKSVQDWPGDSMEVNSWREAVDLACLAAGPDQSLSQHMDGTWPTYSAPHYEYLLGAYPGVAETLARYKTHFWDSISVASRHCWKWAVGQPGSFVEDRAKKDGSLKPDTRGTFGIIAREIVAWLTRIQHTKGINVWVVGGLDLIQDEYKRDTWQPQIEGAKAGRELLGIFDQIVAMVNMPGTDGNLYRAFVCKQENSWRYPAKDRSGRLAMVEPPHLGNLVTKINGVLPPAAERYGYAMPAEPGPAKE